MTLKIVPVKMDDKEKVIYRKGVVQAFIEGKRIGTWLAEVIEHYLKYDAQKNS